MSCLLPDKTRLAPGSDVHAEQIVHAVVLDGRALTGELVHDVAF